MQTLIDVLQSTGIIMLAITSIRHTNRINDLYNS